MNITFDNYTADFYGEQTVDDDDEHEREEKCTAIDK